MVELPTSVSEHIAFLTRALDEATRDLERSRSIRTSFVAEIEELIARNNALSAELVKRTNQREAESGRLESRIKELIDKLNQYYRALEVSRASEEAAKVAKTAALQKLEGSLSARAVLEAEIHTLRKQLNL